MSRRSCSLLVHPPPVLPLHRQGDVTVHHLEGARQIGPREGGPQHRVTVDHPLPGLGERLLREIAVQSAAHLRHVEPRSRRGEGLEQHALLHRRQWIEVLQVRVRRHQPVERDLVEPGQREVRRRVAAGFRRQAVRDEPLKLGEEALRQRLDRGAAVPVLAVRPGRPQPAAGHRDHHVEQPRPPARQRRRAGRLPGRPQQRALLQGAVELAQVVEGDLRLVGSGQRFSPQVAQDTKAEAAVRHPPQLLLDALEQ